MKTAGGEITRVVLMVLVIALLLAGSLFTLMPFLGGIIWAATVVIATWPLLLRVRARVGKRQWLAVVIMTTLILLALILPVRAGGQHAARCHASHTGNRRRLYDPRPGSAARVAGENSRRWAPS